MIKTLLLSLLVISSVEAKVKLEKVEYKSGDRVFEGVVARDSKVKGKKPGVVVFHNWMGVSAETEDKITEMAKLGYVVFAADIYGKGVRPKDSKEAGALAGQYKADLKTLGERATLAVEELKKQKGVDTTKIFAAGYCFGGTTAIVLARTGADLKGIVSFHGGLMDGDNKSIKASLLIQHGAVDPFVPQKDIEAFVKGLNDSKVNYQMTSYANAVHSFTEKAAGNDNSKGAAYNAEADKFSWIAMKEFFADKSKN